MVYHSGFKEIERKQFWIFSMLSHNDSRFRYSNSYRKWQQFLIRQISTFWNSVCVIKKDKMKSCILILFIISFFLEESHQLFSSPAIQREMKKRCPDFRQRAEAEKRVWDCLQEEKLETYRRRRTTYDQVKDNCVFDSPHILGKNTSDYLFNLWLINFFSRIDLRPKKKALRFWENHQDRIY